MISIKSVLLLRIRFPGAAHVEVLGGALLSDGKGELLTCPYWALTCWNCSRVIRQYLAWGRVRNRA